MTKLPQKSATIFFESEMNPPSLLSNLGRNASLRRMMFMMMLMIILMMMIKLITNEENEEAWPNFADVSPGKVCIPWKLLHLLGTRSERKTELCVSKHLKIFSFGGK